MATPESQLFSEASDLYDQYRFDDLPDALKRNSLDYYYLSVYPSLKEMRDLTPDDQPDYPEKIETGYVHTPYCTGVCDFCSYFLTTVNPNDLSPIEAYYESVKQEVDFHADRTELDFGYLFFGGGTPSLIPADTLAGFFDHLRSRQAVTDRTRGTIELHPEFFADEAHASNFLNILNANGINRVSLGYQSSEDDVLDETNRRHDAGFLQEAVTFLKEKGTIINIDLMYGLAGMTYEGWERTLQEVDATNPDSISTYFLFVTPGTVTRSEVKRGKIQLPGHRELQIQHIMAQRFLAEHGYLELPSDFHAKFDGDSSGFTQDRLPSDTSSLPIGAGSYGYYGSTQIYNQFDHNEYAAKMAAGQSPVWRGHKFDDQGNMHRDVMFSFKNSPHLNLELFKDRYGRSPADVFSRTIDKLVELEMVQADEKRITLTDAGRLCVEEICSLFKDSTIAEEQIEATPVTLHKRRKLAKYNFSPSYSGSIED